MTPLEREAQLAILMSQLAERMAAESVSQAEMSRRLQSHPSVISNALKLKTDPRISTIAAMVDSIDCTLVIVSKKTAA